MKKLLPALVATSILSIGSASAITVLSGTVSEFTSPDDLLLDPGTALIAVDSFGNTDRLVNGVLFSTDRAGVGGANVVAEGLVTVGAVSVRTTAANQIDNWSNAPGGPGVVNFTVTP